MVEECLLVTVADGNLNFSKDNALAGDVGDTAQVDNVGTMNAHEVVGRKYLLYAFHREQRHERPVLAFNENTHIFAHAFDIADVIDDNADDAIVVLDIEVAVLFNRRSGLGYEAIGRRLALDALARSRCVGAPFLLLLRGLKAQRV